MHVPPHLPTLTLTQRAPGGPWAAAFFLLGVGSSQQQSFSAESSYSFQAASYPRWLCELITSWSAVRQATGTAKPLGGLGINL